jgi:hypothetical protein
MGELKFASQAQARRYFTERDELDKAKTVGVDFSHLPDYVEPVVKARRSAVVAPTGVFVVTPTPRFGE